MNSAARLVSSAKQEIPQLGSKFCRLRKTVWWGEERIIVMLWLCVLQMRRATEAAVRPVGPVTPGRVSPAAHHSVSRAPTVPAAHLTPATQNPTSDADTTSLASVVVIVVVRWLTAFGWHEANADSDLLSADYLHWN